MEYLPSIPETKEIEFTYSTQSFLSEKPRYNKDRKAWAQKELKKQIKVLNALIEKHLGIN